MGLPLYSRHRLPFNGQGLRFCISCSQYNEFPVTFAFDHLTILRLIPYQIRLQLIQNVGIHTVYCYTLKTRKFLKNVLNRKLIYVWQRFGTFFTKDPKLRWNWYEEIEWNFIKIFIYFFNHSFSNNVLFHLGNDTKYFIEFKDILCI